MEGFGARGWMQRKNERAMRRLRSILERGEDRGTARDRRRRIDCRVACPAACASSRSLALALLAALALGACGDSHTKVTTGTYAGESGANAPYLDVGPLIYEVQLSRQLNPYDVEDAAYLQGLSPAQRRLGPGQEWFAVFMQVYNNSSSAARRPPTGSRSPTPRATSTPRSCPARPTSSPTAAGLIPANGRLPELGHDRRQRPHPGRAAAVQDPDRLARQPPARAQDRRPRTPPRRPRPSSTSEQASV